MQKTMWIGIHGEIAETLDGSYYKGCGTRGGVEREIVYMMQKTTGTLSPGAHPGSYNGQDAYNDLLVCGKRTDASGASPRTSRCYQCDARPADYFEGG